MILALGWSDQQYLGVPLPFTLPGGGCPLLAAPDVALVTTSDPLGRAVHPIPIPMTPALGGSIVFGQWIHGIGGPLLAATDAMALHIYP